MHKQCANCITSFFHLPLSGFVCVVARREVDARAPAAVAPRVGGARRNRNMRAQAETARRLQMQAVADYLDEGEEGVGGRGGEARKEAERVGGTLWGPELEHAGWLWL